MAIHVDPDWWRDLFDEVYLQTDARSVCDPELTRREVDVITEILPLEREHRVVDLCGGQGRHSLELAARGIADCTVVDYSEALLTLGRSEATRRGFPVTFVQSDARDTGLPPAAFDHVLIMGNSLGYLPEPEADAQIVAEAFRLLASGGWLLLDVSDSTATGARCAPNAWHEIGDDIVVCRQREMHTDRICTREMVLSKSGGIIRDEAYAIRLFDVEQLQHIVNATGFLAPKARRGFRPHGRDGDYGFMDRRVIVTARKP